MSVLPNKGRKSALPGQERRLSQDPILQSRFSSSQRKPFLGVIICGTGFSREVRKQVQIATERLGGQYSRDLHLNCTHLVVQNCSGRKYEHAVKHGAHRGLCIVAMSWFEDCVKQNALLDESLYTVPSSNHQIGTILDHPEYSPDDGGATQLRDLLSAAKVESDLEAAERLQPKIQHISLLRVSGGTQGVKNFSSGMYRSTLQASPTIENSSTLAGARFYIDPGLRRDLQFKAQVSVESWGAACVENWSKATHVVCESGSILKYIGLNLHLVSPRWVMSARDGCPLRCVQYSADLARDVGVLLQEWKAIEQHHTNRFFKAPSILHSRVGTEKILTLQERETKASLAKAGVRRRRGPRTQVHTRPHTPASLLESIYWIVTDSPAMAQVYTHGSGRGVSEHGKSVSQFSIHHSCYRKPKLYEAFEDNIYTKPLSRREKQEIVFPGSFLTILFPLDRFSELGPSSRTFFSDAGFTTCQIIHSVHTFYQEALEAVEVNAAMHTDSKHGDRLRAGLQSGNSGAMARHQLLGTRVQFRGLQRTHSVDPCSHTYDLCLASPPPALR